MLDLDRNFDETGLGFSKFSKFLTQAHEHDIVRIRRNEAGNFVVRLPRSHRARGADAASAGSPEESGTPAGADGAASGAPTVAAGTPGAAAEAGEGDSGSGAVDEAAPAESAETTASPSAKKGGRRTPRSPRQRMWRQSQRARERGRDERAGEDGRADPKPAFDPARLGLPTDSSAVQRYLANRYRGVGEKTAERLIEAFGDRVFHVLHDSLDKVNGVLPRNRAAKLAEAWQDDFSRRSRAESKADRQATATARRTRLGRRRGSS